MPDKKFGATGTFPRGKKNPHDEGALQLGVATDEAGDVVINFGTPVAWLAMPPEQAINFAKLILMKAGAKKLSWEV